MSNDFVVHMTKVVAGSTVASGRIATFISTTLDLPLIDTEAKAQGLKEIDTLIIVNGPMAFCDFLPELGRLVSIAHKVVWVQNDYTIAPPKASGDAESPFRKAFADKKLRPIYWTTVSDNVQGGDDTYVNWNALTWDVRPMQVPEVQGLFYYGAFREHRVKSFEKFFSTEYYDVHISTTGQRATKFKSIAPNVNIVAPSKDIISDIGKYQASIYIEDDKSHHQFHSLANRFYECVSSGGPLLVDANCVGVFAGAGVQLKPDWIVRDAKDVYEALTQSIVISEAQRTVFGELNHKEQLFNQLLDAYAKL